MRFHKQILLVVMTMFLLTGCWDKRNMEDRSYVITMGVDKYRGDEKNRYVLSLGSAEISALSGGTKDAGESEPEGDITAIQVEGSTLAEAIHRADCFHSRKMYLGQLKTVIFGKTLLEDKELFLNALDELERNPDISEKTILLASRGSAMDCVEIVLHEDTSTGLFIWDFYKNTAQDVAVTEKMDLETFLMDLRNSNGQGILPQVHVEKDKIRFGGGTALANFALCGDLSDEQERGMLLLKEKGKGAVYGGRWQNSIVPFSVYKNNTDFSFEEKGDSLVCQIDMDVDGSIDGKDFFANSLFKDKEIKKLEDLFGNVIKTEIENTIKIAQEGYKQDILNISSKLHQKKPKLYEKYGANPNVSFQNMTFDVNVKVNVQTIGVVQ